MKYVLVLILLNTPMVPAWARTTEETGFSHASGFCNYANAYFCLSRIRQDAERNAIYQATLNCQAKGGIARRYNNFCSTHCVPNSLRPDQQDTLVYCNARCKVECDIRD